jgi:hypothetical protein
LGEALDELCSVQMTKKLLQKELLLHMTSKSTWEIDPDSTDYYNGDPAVNSEWALVTAKIHMDKLKK